MMIQLLLFMAMQSFAQDSAGFCPGGNCDTPRSDSGKLQKLPDLSERTLVGVRNGCFSRGFKGHDCKAIQLPNGNVLAERSCGHLGVDFDGGNETINAKWGGRIQFAGYDASGYGKRVVIDHGDGRITTYSHLSSIIVRVGQIVARCAPLGNMGATGGSYGIGRRGKKGRRGQTGTHLHFEELRGMKFVDPGGSSNCYVQEVKAWGC